MNIVFCSFLGADVYNCIVVFCCVYLYGMWPNCLGDDQVENGVRCDWEALYIFHGLLMPTASTQKAPHIPVWGGSFGQKMRRQETS